MDEGLLAEVIAHPEDDGVRAVLADVLQATGDPRGELISLQLLASRGNHDRDERIHELLRAHGKAWLASLWQIAGACRFDRGFPSRLALACTWPVDDPRWDDVLADPALATVEDLIPGAISGDVYRRIVARAPNLRRIELFDRASLEGLAEAGPRIEHVACTAFTETFDWDPPAERTVPRFQWARSLDNTPEHPPRAAYTRMWAALGDRPQLTSIAIPAGCLQDLLHQRWYPRITTLTLGGGSLRAHLARWDELGQRHLILVPHAQLEPCERRFPWDYKIELVPDGAGAIARISGEWITMPTAVLESLPREVRRVEIEHSSPLITARLRDHVARPGIEVIEVPLRANNFVWEIR